MRKYLLPLALVMAAVMMWTAPMTASAAEIVVPAGYRTVNVDFTGIDNVSMSDDGTLSLRVNGTVNVNDVIRLIDDQLAFGGSVEESCTTRMRWVPGTTQIMGASGGTLNLQSTLALAQRTCEPSMSMYTTSEHAVDYSIDIAGSTIDDLTLSLDVSAIAGMDMDSSLSAARLDQIADANINPVQEWSRGIAKAIQTGCLATADVGVSPVEFSADGSMSVGITAAGNLADMSRCVVLDSAIADLATGTSVVALILSDLQADTIASIVDGAMMGHIMPVDSYIGMVAGDLADETWKAIVVEALSLDFVQETVMGGMGDMVPPEMADLLFSDVALEQIWGELLLSDISADTLEALVMAVASGTGDVNALSGELIGQIQPATIALALARLLTLG